MTLFTPTRSYRALVAFAITLFAVPFGSVRAVDTVSMASPDREPIWTARLFFIAVNEPDAESLFGLFTNEATIQVEGPVGHPRPLLPAGNVDAVSRRAWLERMVMQRGVRVRNRGGEVDDRTITVVAEWSVGDETATVVIVFEQSEDGRIAAMRITPREE